MQLGETKTRLGIGQFSGKAKGDHVTYKRYETVEIALPKGIKEQATGGSAKIVADDSLFRV